MEGLSRYICGWWCLDHIKKTVTRHVRTAVPLRHLRYSRSSRTTISLNVQTVVTSEKTVMLHVQTIFPLDPQQILDFVEGSCYMQTAIASTTLRRPLRLSYIFDEKSLGILT